MKNEIQQHFYWPQYACDIFAHTFAHTHTPTLMHIYLYTHIGTQKYMYSRFICEGEAWERVLLKGVQSFEFSDMLRRYLEKGQYAMSIG